MLPAHDRSFGFATSALVGRRLPFFRFATATGLGPIGCRATCSVAAADVGFRNTIAITALLSGRAGGVRVTLRAGGARQNQLPIWYRTYNDYPKTQVDQRSHRVAIAQGNDTPDSFEHFLTPLLSRNVIALGDQKNVTHLPAFSSAENKRPKPVAPPQTP
jgi:hypothetical protein